MPVSPVLSLSPLAARKPFGGRPPGVDMAIMHRRVGAQKPRIRPAILGTVRADVAAALQTPLGRLGRLPI